MTYSGPERRADVRERNWWRIALWVWIVVFSAIVIVGLVQNRHAAADIQRSRRDSITFQCQLQNQRHDNAVKELDALIAHASKTATPARKKQLHESRSSTVLLIDALAPRQDCGALAETLLNVGSNVGANQ